VRLFTRNGYDFTARFPKIAVAVADLPVQSCVIDGEAIVVDRQGLSVFDLLRDRHYTMLRYSALSILSNSTATTSASNRSKPAKTRLLISFANQAMA